MSQSSRTILHFILMFLLLCLPVFAQRRAGGAATHAYSSSHAAPVYGGAGWYGGYGGYASLSSPLNVPPPVLVG